jgi:hypothetical protein
VRETTSTRRQRIKGQYLPGCSDSNFVFITDNIFQKAKSVGEVDVEDEQSLQVVFEVECSQTLLSFVQIVEQQIPTAPQLNQMFMFIPGSQSSAEADVSENTSDV